MKFLTPAAILALATVVSATAPGPTQCDVKTSAIPPCATACIEDAGTQFGCSKDNYWCQCDPDTYSKINSAALNCVLDECGIGKAGAVIAAANDVCSCASSYPSPTATPPPATTSVPEVTPPPVTPTPTVTPTATLGDPSQCDASTSAFPACASACIEAAGAAIGCSKTDFHCQCEEDNFIAINLGAFECVYGGCGEAGTTAAVEAGMAVCECVSSYPLPGTTTPPATSTSGPVQPTDVTTPDVPTDVPTDVTTPNVPTDVPTDVPTATPTPTGTPSCTQTDGPTECAASASAIPTCAKSCIEDAGAQFGCSKTDYRCQCDPDTFAKINGAALNCVLDACGISGALPVVEAANAVCACASSYPATETCTAAPTSPTGGPVEPTDVTKTPGPTTTPATTPATTPSTTPSATATPSCTQVAGPTECAASASAIPTCAKTCIEDAGAQFGCSKTDYRCQCDPDTFAKINGAALNCVLDACGISGALPVVEAANAVCDCASSYPAPTSTCAGGPEPTGPVNPTTGGDGPATTPGATGTPTSCSQAAGPTECATKASAIPTCATPCIEEAGAQFGCSKTDYWCQCEPDTYAKINKAALNCVVTACGISEAPAVLEAANAVCECASSFPAPTCPGGPAPTAPPGGGQETGTKSTTLTYTITSCPPAVTECPIGHVTTTVVPCTTDEPEPTGGSGSGGSNGGGEGGSGSGSGPSSDSGSQTTTSAPAQFTGSASTLQPFMVAIAAMLVTVGVFAAR